MNNGELKQRLVNYSHRGDLTPNLQGFINDAGQRINNRFGLLLGDLFNDLDTNYVLGNHSILYFYAAMRELSIFIKDFDEGSRFNELFDREASEMNINNMQDSWTDNTITHPYVTSEIERSATADEVSS